MARKGSVASALVHLRYPCGVFRGPRYFLGILANVLWCSSEGFQCSGFLGIRVYKVVFILFTAWQSDMS